MDDITRLKKLIREDDYPMFSDEDLQFYLAENNGNVEHTAYECLILKSENTTLNVSGLSTVDSSSYFKRLASRYRPNNSRILGG